MAIFYADVRAFSRAKGQSSVAAAAYRIGHCLRDERTGEWHNYSSKKGVIGVHIHAPADAPPWATQASELWSRVEAHETRKNSCVARELIVALPVELPEPQRAILACSIAQWLVDRYGVAVMTALHAPDRKGDNRNFHAHLLMTTRRVTPTGFGPKVRVLDDRSSGKLEVRAIRAMVAERTNEALRCFGLDIRIDHRTLRAQSIEAENQGDIVRAVTLLREPSRHEGRAHTAAKRQGHNFGRAQRNRMRTTRNTQRHTVIEAQLVRAATRPLAPRPTRARSILPTSRDSMRASRAQGQGAAVLNAQAQALRETIQVEAELADAFHRMLLDAHDFRTVHAVHAAPSVSEPALFSTHHSSPSGAHQKPFVSPPNPSGGESVANRAAPRSKRQWAEYRRRQRSADAASSIEPRTRRFLRRS